MVFRVLTDVLSFNFFTIPSLSRKTEIWIDEWCWTKSSLTLLLFFPLVYLHFALFYEMVCVSIILAHMLASLDCVTRQECWEPFLPKHLKRCESITTGKTNIEALTCKPCNLLQLTNEQRPPEKQWMTWKRHLPSSTTCCHMINKKKLVFPHHPSSQTWQSLPPKVFRMKYMMNALRPHVWNNFLSLSDSKKVRTGITILKLLPTLKMITSNDLWVLTCLYVMKTLNKNWCWLTLWSKCTHLFRIVNQEHPTSQPSSTNKEVTHLVHQEMKIIDWTSRLFQRKMNWIERRRVCFNFTKGKRTNRILKMFPLNNFKYF